jgi:hypothetical protein
MRRSTRFFVGLAAAILTYAGLTAAFGPRHLQYRDGHPYRAYGYGRHYPCDDAGRVSPSRPDAATPPAEPFRQPTPSQSPNN